MQQSMESILPLVAVSNDPELERRAVEKDKLHSSYGVHLLDLIAELDVLVDGAVKVHYSWVLVSPSFEEGVLLCFPDHLESECVCVCV